MKNLNKIDKTLFKVLSMNVNEKIECIAYVSDFSKAKRYFNVNEIIREFPFINALALEINSNKLIEICNHSWIKNITKGANALALMNVSRKILGAENSNLTGKDVTIAYIDTGISSHLDFCLKRNRIIKFVDLVNGKKRNYDDNGHGTFVSGVGSGNGITSGGKYSGIAPLSNIVSIKALNQNGEANAVTILDAMQWIYDNVKKYNIKVVCMSFGSEPLGNNDPIMKGAEVLWNKGITMVAAAGNSGPEFETIKSPGISPKIITVGGLNDNRDDNGNYEKEKFSIASFSSRGPALRRYKPDLVAPSINITSCSFQPEKFYTVMNGTSVATPMIAGLSALLLEKDQNLTPEQVKFKLMSMSSGITFNRNLEGVGIPYLR
ncbi:MAG: S8 family peptidase [Christensenellales bacterium]